jgi:hypothetical protein
LEDFNFDHQPALNRDMIAHLGTGAFLAKSRNVVLLGPPGTGKTHLAIGLAVKAAQTGHGIAFATAVDWVARLKPAHNASRLPAELAKLRRIGLLVVDEVGYIPFEQDAANLFFQLVSSRYEHASLILTSNLPFARWGDVFGDQVVAAAMIDRIVHHADVLAPATDSRTPESTPCPPPEQTTRHTNHDHVAYFSPRRSWPIFRPSSTLRSMEPLPITFRHVTFARGGAGRAGKPTAVPARSTHPVAAQIPTSSGSPLAQYEDS